MANSTVKRIPERKCMGCNEKRPKKELIRVVRTPEGNVELDEVGKKSGRGAYICPKKACFERAYKSKRLERCLEIEIPEDIYTKIKQSFSEETDE